MSGELSAGYCGSCNRAVTVRKRGGGLLHKLTSLVGSDGAEGQWECTRCGKPAGKSFTLPPSGRQGDAAAAPTAAPVDEMPAPPPEAASDEYRECPHCAGSIRREAFKCIHCNLEVTPLPKLVEATCHICGNTLRYDEADSGQTRSCPTCTGIVALPVPEAGRTSKTTPPLVQKLAGDPDRPALTLALCSACDHHFAYQKIHAGRKVSCPSCQAPFTLP